MTCCLQCSLSQGNELLPLTPHVDVFLHDCANAIWSLKGLKDLHIFTLITFLHQKVSITLQRMQASSILNKVIATCLAIL
jgi:hypothetical protein